MNNQVMCRCGCCKQNTIGIRTGLSGIGHLFNIVLVFLTGLFWAIPYLIIVACSGQTRCTQCGYKCRKL